MALVCDTGAVYALYDADDAHHEAARSVVESEIGELFLPVALLAEIDYLLTTRLGSDAAIDFIESVAAGAFSLQSLGESDLARCRELMQQYSDLTLGLADASVVATAERLGVQRLFTVDERHLRTIRPATFSHFVLLPADRNND